MFSAFQTFGRLGAGARAVAAAWTPAALWPTGTEAGMWIDPSNLASQWQDSTGTTPVATPGTVADSSNPVGLALDLRLGATALTDPGNHLLQATSTARPLLSARVNLLTYTEDFSSVWVKAGCTTSAQTPPQGYSSAIKYIKDSGGGFGSVYRYYNVTGPFVFSAIAKRAEWQYLGLYLQNPDRFGYFDLLNGVVGTVSAGLTATIEDLGDGWYRCAVAHTANGTNTPSIFATPTDNVYMPTGDGVSGIYVTAAQYNSGGVSAPYQPILTDGSTYDATGITPFQLYDGTDDGMATASFAAGTLSNNMDCLIAVRRSNNFLPQILGLYQADHTKYFGVVSWISPDADGTFGGCGTPTIFVNNVETANTRGDLFDAMPYGEWCILEYRGLDLSAWVNANFGNYSSYQVNGARGDIMLYPSTASTEDKDNARQYLADKYGVTLP